MIRISILIMAFFVLCSPTMAENETAYSSLEAEGQNLTNITGNQTTTDLMNGTSPSDLNMTESRFNETEQGTANISAEGVLNLTATDSNLTEEDQNATKAEEKPEKPVYKQSIGSVYSADFTEPQGRTFTTSGCA